MPGTSGPLSEALAFQADSLQHVSRTFALTIPQLPPGLVPVVGNAYLLCRIADTIEDSEALAIDEKRGYYAQFIRIVEGTEPPDGFAAELPPKLQGSTLEAERELVANTALVVRLTHSFSREDQAALLRCLRVMAEGMERFQAGRYASGLDDQAHMDAYCYHVAGVVGEMLTALFCAHSPEVAVRRAALEPLAVSFGQGLQMTNILKDIWDDKARDMCWLPRQEFEVAGANLDDLGEPRQAEAFEQGLGDLIGVARAHLDNALRYTLLIPKSEEGIRRFCLWAIGMAVLTLRKINRRRGFRSGDEVKISRRSVRLTIGMTNLLARSDFLLRVVFKVMALGLPRPPAEGGGPHLRPAP